MMSSPLNVFVAAELVCNIFPPEIVRPSEDSNPPAVIPPVNVEVAELKDSINPLALNPP